MTENNCDRYTAPLTICPSGSWSTDGTIYGLKSDGSRGCDSFCPPGTTALISSTYVNYFLFYFLTENNCTHN